MNTKNISTEHDTNQKQLKLYILPDQVLRKDCMDVEVFDKQLQIFGKKMLSFMKEKKGIGLAAPQVGVLQRIIVVCFQNLEMVLINPSIMPVTTDSITKTEGCLSIPNETFNVTRLFQIEVRARDTKGKRLHFAAHSLLARVIQHEVDHLDGILICDKEAGRIGSRKGVSVIPYI